MKTLIKDKVKILIILFVIIVLIILKVSTKIIINKRFIAYYPEANQEIRLVLMSFINIYEPYIAPYNYGNYYYQKGRYEEAYDKYIKALKYKVPKKRECAVRINTGLTLVKMSEQKETEKTKLLQEALEHLKKCFILKNDEDDNYDDELDDLQQKASEISDGIGEEIGKGGGSDSQGGSGTSSSDGSSSGNEASNGDDSSGGNGKNGGMFGVSGPPNYDNYGTHRNGDLRQMPPHYDEKCHDCW